MKKKDNPKSVAFATLGCKVNQCESASFQSCFEGKGFAVNPFDAAADIYVINTCAVTAKAAAQSRQLVRRALRTNPRARVMVTGCYAQVEPQKIRELAAASVAIVGNANKHQIFAAAMSADMPRQSFEPEQAGEYFSDIAGQHEMCQLPVKRFPGRTRAFLKVQDGCNNFCSYCIVPYARGRSRSLAQDKVLHQARGYTREGHKEIVLTGIHVGHYGLDLEPASTLLDLLQNLTAAAPGIRYRLSSLEPAEINRDLLAFMAAAENFMPHLHIPLQSGSDAILKKMRRRYTTAQFIEKVHLCKEMLPTAAIGVDVLVGFPGETETDFQNTYETVMNLPVAYLHVFPFSKRPGTPAAKMAGQVAAGVKDERVAVLRKLDHKKRTDFYRSRIGKVHAVLVEAEKPPAAMAKGFTDNYIPVQFKAGPDAAGRVVPVKLERLQGSYVLGIPF